jgi:phosphatidylserine/phosphatidylglycerophosphate/cardiolipin synthase-like enzyme
VNQLGQAASSEARTIDFGDGVQHAKYFVVDGKNNFVGSQNFDWRALSHIHEIGMRVEDTVVATQLEKIFEKDWAEGKVVAAGAPAPAPMKNGSVRAASAGTAPTVVAAPEAVNPDGVGYSLDAIEDLIRSARQSVRVQVMEYTTKNAKAGTRAWKALDDTLRAAAGRGVQVELMVDISDVAKAKADLKSLAALKNVQVKSVTIPPWSGGNIPYARLVHSKYLLVDDSRAWVGSENWSEGYFTQTRDVGLVTTDADVLAKLSQVFERVWQSAYASPL